MMPRPPAYVTLHRAIPDYARRMRAFAAIAARVAAKPARMALEPLPGKGDALSFRPPVSLREIHDFTFGARHR